MVGQISTCCFYTSQSLSSSRRVPARAGRCENEIRSRRKRSDSVYGSELLAAIPTAVLGWLFAAAGNGVSSPQLLMAHRWFGTTAAVWLIATAVFTERDAVAGSEVLPCGFY